MRRAVWILAVPAGWYGFLLVLPDIDGRLPALTARTLSYLRSHTMSICAGTEKFGDRSRGSMLSRLEEQRMYGNGYTVIVAKDQDDQPEGVILYPAKCRSYKHGTVQAILQLKTTVATFPAYVMLPNGDIFENMADGFDASHTPSVHVIEDVATSERWDYVQNYRNHDLCAALSVSPDDDTSGEQP